jgi:1-acyl-sn-glycerol-3-phosphate acyltransferase
MASGPGSPPATGLLSSPPLQRSPLRRRASRLAARDFGKRHLMLRAMIAVPLIVLWSAVFGAAACIAGILDRSGRAGYWVGRVWGQLVVRTLGIRVLVEGQSNAGSAVAVFAANHSSALDIPLLFGWLPTPFRFVYKRSLARIPLLGWSLPLNGHVSVDRGNAIRARRSLDTARLRLAEGVSVVAFPEGTRSADEALRRFKRGPFILAIDAQTPVVPVSLVGVRRLVGSGLKGFRPGTVRLAVHPPITTLGRSSEDAATLAEKARQVIEAGCAN